MGLKALFNGAYDGRSVFVTGHTGFKGSWLSLWLQQMGASVTGYSLAPPTTPNHWDCLNLEMTSYEANLSEYDALLVAMQKAAPEIVFHLAAQPLVLTSYQDPLETLQTNVMGTAHVLEAARSIPSLKAVCIITTDKCYFNQNTPVPYVENAPLGGRDPYSASKACTELVAQSYRASFLKDQDIGVATCRGGNVIGGGDWGHYRLLPDLIQTVVSDTTLAIRYPQAVRPWQHVLDCLSGYLVVGQHLLAKTEGADEAWNVGPVHSESYTVLEIIELISEFWKPVSVEIAQGKKAHEEHHLTLDSTKLSHAYGWEPIWDTRMSVQKTIEWAKAYALDNQCISQRQLQDYVADAVQKHVKWAV